MELDSKRIIRAFERRFNNECVLGIRLHPKVVDSGVYGNGTINCSGYPNMQELLCSVDAVISDYSSLIWDFSFTNRPVFIYAPDIKKYEAEHGFYLPSARWPYPIAQNNDEMKENIIGFDESVYSGKVKEHHKESGSYEEGKACEVIMKLIEK